MDTYTHHSPCWHTPQANCNKPGPIALLIPSEYDRRRALYTRARLLVYGLVFTAHGALVTLLLGVETHATLRHTILPQDNMYCNHNNAMLQLAAS